MKKEVCRNACRMLIAVASLMMAFAVFTDNCEAATKKIVLPQNLYSLEIEDIEEGDAFKTIKKTGTYEIVIKENENGDMCGYLKFIPPKTKTYTITVGPVKGNRKNDLIFGNVQGLKGENRKECRPAVFKMKDGKNASLNIATEEYSDCLKKRTGTLRLKKGKPIYFWFEFHKEDDDMMSTKCTAKLIIK